MQRVILVLFTLFFVVFCNAQESEYVQDFSHNINAKLGIDTKSFSYKITNSVTNEKFDLKPNESVRLAASVHYRFIGLTVGFSPNFLNNNEDEKLKGESDINSIQLRLFIKRFIQEFEYNKIQGFYVENTADFDANWIKNTDPYIQLKNLTIKRFGGKTSFVWNKNFSFKALLMQNQKQLKSAGSFVPSMSYYYSELNNPKNEFISLGESNIDLNVTAGYIHNFVFGSEQNYFASLGLSYGFGVKFAKNKIEDTSGVFQEKKETYTNSIFEGRLNLGYNSNKIFTGVQFNINGVSYNKDQETNVEDSNSYLQLYLGYRFGAPKVIERLFDKIHKQ
ncbi:MAG: DUF4421 family protein [Flavobacteriaceae bacterium]|nr:DUF4421 family protein [Flavobacteriaceae bacterium]